MGSRLENQIVGTAGPQTARAEPHRSPRFRGQGQRCELRGRGRQLDVQDTQAPRRGGQCAPKPHAAPGSAVFASPCGSLPQNDADPQNTPIRTLTHPERAPREPLGNPCPEHVGESEPDDLKDQASDIEDGGAGRGQTPTKRPPWTGLHQGGTLAVEPVARAAVTTPRAQGRGPRRVPGTAACVQRRAADGG